MNQLNTFSFIIPVKPGGYVASCRHICTVMPEDVRYEILLVEGKSPSQQRNCAAREAAGDILYFLDDDSLIKQDNLAVCSDGFNDPSVAVVGGPSLTPEGDSWLQQLFGAALASPFGSGAVHSRYHAHGKRRVTTEKELILCNLAVRRSLFIELGGFNERLYPNEENEFLDRVADSGYTLLHDPSMVIFRSQRRTLRAFIRQMFTYGRGRGQQTLITSSCSITSFIPFLFDVYLIVALIGIKYILLLVPLVIYLCLSFLGSLRILNRTRRSYALFLPGIYLLMHVVNGVGLFWGLLNGKPEQLHDGGIQVQRIKSLGKSYAG